MFSSIKKSEHREEVERPHAIFDTTQGKFEVELYAKECPETVWNFINLAEGKQETERSKKTGAPFYNGIVFHRVIKGFMIQAGCPEGMGSGGPGYQFKDEFNRDLKHNVKGILSMANRGPGTNGSQFFVTLAPTPHLDGKHTVFGKVIEGMDIVEAIGRTRTGAQDRPVEPMVINSITIKR